jgi:hypothetical protein
MVRASGEPVPLVSVSLLVAPVPGSLLVLDEVSWPGELVDPDPVADADALAVEPVVLPEAASEPEGSLQLTATTIARRPAGTSPLLAIMQFVPAHSGDVIRTGRFARPSTVSSPGPQAHNRS